jgi:hypothetical protein
MNKSQLRIDIEAYAEELFDLFWTNARVYMRFPKKDRKSILDDYNDLYDYYIMR